MQIIPLNKTHDGHLELQASINGVTGTFVLDTGATGTVLDINKLSQFGLSVGQERINGVAVGDKETGRIDTFPVEITEFSIHRNKVDIKLIFANDVSGQLGPEVMGLVGNDALINLNALIDVKNSQLLIPQQKNDPQSVLAESSMGTYETISLQKSPMGFSFVDVKINENDVRLLVDTGAPQIVLDESALVQLGYKLEEHPTAKSVVAEGVELPMKVYKNGFIALGNLTLSDDFFTTDFTALMNAVNVEGEPKLIGILGNKHLAQLNTIIDASNAKLYIKN